MQHWFAQNLFAVFGLIISVLALLNSYRANKRIDTDRRERKQEERDRAAWCVEMREHLKSFTSGPSAVPDDKRAWAEWGIEHKYFADASSKGKLYIKRVT